MVCLRVTVEEWLRSLPLSKSPRSGLVFRLTFGQYWEMSRYLSYVSQMTRAHRSLSHSSIRRTIFHSRGKWKRSFHPLCADSVSSLGLMPQRFVRECLQSRSSEWTSSVSQLERSFTFSREKMKVPANVIDQLVQGAQSDIRQVLNMLSTWKLSSSTIDFDEGKNLYVWLLISNCS